MPSKHVLSSSAVDGQGCRARTFNDLGNVDCVDVVSGTTKPNFGGDGSGSASFDDFRNNFAHLVRCPQQVASAFCFFRDLFDRATEIDIHNADLVIFNKPPANFGHCLWLIIPNLHGQRSRFVFDTPQSIRMLWSILIKPNEAACVHHFCRDQTCPTVLAYNLTKRIISESRHGCLEYGRIDRHVSNLNWFNARDYKSWWLRG